MGNKKHKPKNKHSDNTIALNRKARHQYNLETKFEAGIVLEGWEVKSIRAGKAQIADSYVILKKGEAWLLNAIISPLLSASTHKVTEPSRSRKLLLHKKELNTLLRATERRGYTLVPTCLYWKKNTVKIEVALAKGKKDYDKRHASKEQDWKLQKQRILKKNSQVH